MDFSQLTNLISVENIFDLFFKTFTVVFSGFIAEHNLFLIIEIEEGIGVDKGREMLQKLKNEISTTPINSLSSFDQFTTRVFIEYNVPSSFSLAAGYLKDNVFFLKTVGAGKIFLNRSGNFARIIGKDNNASGYVEVEDFFIFT